MPSGRPPPKKPPNAWRRLRRPLFEGALPAICYFAPRALGASELHALVLATTAAIAQVAVATIRTRKLDFFSASLVLMFGSSLAIALASHDARLAQAPGAVPAACLGAAFLASRANAKSKPLTEAITEKMRPHLAAAALRQQRERDGNPYRSLHRRLSLFCGLLAIGQSAFILTVVFRCPIDVAQIANPAMLISTTGAAALINIAALRRFLGKP